MGSERDFADVSLYLYGDKSALIEFTERDVHVTLDENKAGQILSAKCLNLDGRTLKQA